MAAPPDRRVVSRFGVPDLGVGVGYRVPHYRHVVEQQPAMDWFEVISENFMVDGGAPRHFLGALASRYPVIPHGVSLSLGSAVAPGYLDRLAALIQALNPPWWSDHLCFTGVVHDRVHDLLPVPYTTALRDHVVDRIRAAQDRVGRPFALENVSSYLQWRDSAMPEWDFLGEVAERADCGLLLDVNNIYVSAWNHGFDPETYVDAVPADRVLQIHLAGHSLKEAGHRLDTHDHPVSDPVWALYRRAIRRFGPVSTLIEWDARIPSFERLSEEAALARSQRQAALEPDRAAG